MSNAHTKTGAVGILGLQVGEDVNFAMGEAIAHMHGLWLSGRLKRELGTDGVFRFAPASPKGVSQAGTTQRLATRKPAPARS